MKNHRKIPEEAFFTAGPKETVGHKLCHFITILALLFGLTRTRGAEFSLDGNIKYQVFSLGGEPIVEQDCSFTFTEKDGKWHIRAVPKRFVKRGKEQPLLPYEIASSDSTNFYEIDSLKGFSVSNGWNVDSLGGRIGPGSVPFGLSDPRLIVLWYAFGSSLYFRDITTNYIVPPTIIGGEEAYANDFRGRASWELEKNPPFLPVSICFLGEYKFGANKRLGGIYSASNFTNCVYSAHDFKENAGLFIPRSITAEYFNRNPTNEKIAHLGGEMKIEVIQVQKNDPRVAFRPDLSSSAFLSDMRTISKATPFGIAVDDAHDWPDLKKSQRLAEAVALSRAQNPSKEDRNPLSSRKNIIRLILIVLILLPIVVVGKILTSRKAKS